MWWLTLYTSTVGCISVFFASGWASTAHFSCRGSRWGGHAAAWIGKIVRTTWTLLLRSMRLLSKLTGHITAYSVDLTSFDIDPLARPAAVLCLQVNLSCVISLKGPLIDSYKRARLWIGFGSSRAHFRTVLWNAACTAFRGLFARG